MSQRSALIGVLALLWIAPVLAGPRKVHVAVGVDASEKVADRYIGANMELVQKWVPQAVQACAREADPAMIADFELAVEVGRGGKARKTVATPTNAFTGCVGKAVSNMTFTEPPHDGLGVYFEVAFRE